MFWTFSSASGPPAAPAGTSNLTVYEITVGNQTRFYPQLVIEIPYDPSVIPAGADVSDVIRGVWWDEVTGTWKDVPSAVDETRHVVVLTANHLSIQGYTALLEPPPVTEVDTSHFVVHFDPADDAVIASSWGGAFTTAKQLANTVSSELEHAYSVYGDRGYLPPVPSRFCYDGRIHVTIGDYYASEWGWFSKEISVARRPFVPKPTAAENVALIQGEMDHELFHAVENAYKNVNHMLMNRWWMDGRMDGWADYASTYICGRQSDFPMDAAFFKKPLTTVDGSHEYQIAHFIKFLETRVVGAREAWIYTALSSDSAVQSLDLLLRSKGTSLSVVYRAFLFERIWTPGSYGENIFPGTWLNRTWPIDEGILDEGLVTMDEKTHHLERSIAIPAGGTTRVWGIAVMVPLLYTSQEDRSIVGISAQDGLPEGVTFTLKSPDAVFGSRPIVGPDGGPLLAFQPFPPNWNSLAPPGTSDHLLYLILTNTGTSDRTIRVSVDETTFNDATPRELFAEGNVELGPIPVVAEIIPSGVDTVRFDDGYSTSTQDTKDEGIFFTEDRVPRVDVPVIGGRAETTMYFRDDYVGDEYVFIRVSLPTDPTTGLFLAGLGIPVHVRAPEG